MRDALRPAASPCLDLPPTKPPYLSRAAPPFRERCLRLAHTGRCGTQRLSRALEDHGRGEYLRLSRCGRSAGSAPGPRCGGTCCRSPSVAERDHSPLGRCSAARCATRGVSGEPSDALPLPSCRLAAVAPLSAGDVPCSRFASRVSTARYPSRARVRTSVPPRDAAHVRHDGTRRDRRPVVSLETPRRSPAVTPGRAQRSPGSSS